MPLNFKQLVSNFKATVEWEFQGYSRIKKGTWHCQESLGRPGSQHTFRKTVQLKMYGFNMIGEGLWARWPAERLLSWTRFKIFFQRTFCWVTLVRNLTCCGANNDKEMSLFFIAKISSDPKILDVLFIKIINQFWKSFNLIVKNRN